MIDLTFKQVVDKREVENEARRCPFWFPATIFHQLLAAESLGCCGNAPASLVAEQRQFGSQMCLQAGTLTLGAVGTSTATRRATADNLEPDRLSPSSKW